MSADAGRFQSTQRTRGNGHQFWQSVRSCLAPTVFCNKSNTGCCRMIGRPVAIASEIFRKFTILYGIDACKILLFKRARIEVGTYARIVIRNGCTKRNESIVTNCDSSVIEIDAIIVVVDATTTKVHEKLLGGFRMQEPAVEPVPQLRTAQIPVPQIFLVKRSSEYVVQRTSDVAKQWRS